MPVLTIQFYSKSVHVLIKEKTEIFFFVFLRSWWKKSSFTLKGLTCERLSDVIVCQGVKIGYIGDWKISFDCQQSKMSASFSKSETMRDGAAERKETSAETRGVN